MSSNNDEQKAGMLRKRGSRMRNWSSRYVILNGPKLSYKVKADSPTVRGTFDLAPGCIITEVLEDSMGIKGKKLFSFWIVWPHDKHDKLADEKSVTQTEESDDDEHEDDVHFKPKHRGLKHIIQSEIMNHKKDLKHIVQSEMLEQRLQQQKVEEEIERHHKYDYNISLGIRVAALAVGGVVVGALTAGVGLVPYITVVGISAVAGGGAVALQFRRPSDSRLILATDTMAEAIEWRTAIERQITKLEDCRKPMLPISVDPHIISSIIGMSTAGGGWQCVKICEGMRILEQTIPAAGTCCRKAQVVVQSTPIQTFLALMDGSLFWPQKGSCKVLKSLDDHADIIGVTVRSERTYYGRTYYTTRTICLSRFWKLEDDGVYLITLNIAQHPNFPAAVSSSWNSKAYGIDMNIKKENKEKKGGNGSIDLSVPTSSSSTTSSPAPSPTYPKPRSSSIDKDHKDYKEQREQKEQKQKSPNTIKHVIVAADTTGSSSGPNSSSGCRSSDYVPPTINAVITISPRKDNADYEDDVPEALVSATCQTSTSGWEAKDLEHFLNQFLHDHLIELRQYLMYSKCGLEEKGMAHTAVPQTYPPVPLGDKILYAKKRSPKSPVLRVHDSGYSDMNMNDLYSSSHSNNYSTSSGNGTGTGSGSASGTGSGSSSGNGLSTVGTKEEQKLHLSVSHSLTRQHQHTQSLVPLTLQTTPYVHPPAHTQSHIHAHTYAHGTDSGHPSPAHSPGIQVPDPFAEHSHGEPSTPDVVPQHRGGARGLMRRLAPSRENSKGAGLGHALGSGMGSGGMGAGSGGTGAGSGGITTVQPGDEDNAHLRSSSSHHPLPPATWRTSPGSFNLDAELTDQLMKTGMGHSQSSSGNVSPVPDHSVANKRKISLRKSLSSLSPFSHAHNPAPAPAPSSSSLTPPQSTTPAHKAHPHTVRSISIGNGIGMGSGTGAGAGTGTMSGNNSPKHHNQSEPSSPWGLSQPFPTQQNTHTPTQSLSSIQNMGGKRRNRSNNSNPEASVLRGQIAAKEYEVQRIAKDLERRREKDRKHESIANPSLGMISRVADPKPKTSETAAQLYHQSQELAKLKSQYLALTDTPYEQSNRRKGLSRLRVFGGGSSAAAGSDHHDGSTVTGTTDTEAGSRIGDAMRIRTLSYPSTTLSMGSVQTGKEGSYRLPTHWQPTQLERFDSAQHMQNSKEDGRKNILLVCVFVACMTCTIFLAKILFLH